MTVLTPMLGKLSLCLGSGTGLQRREGQKVSWTAGFLQIPAELGRFLRLACDDSREGPTVGVVKMNRGVAGWP